MINVFFLKTRSGKKNKNSEVNGLNDELDELCRHVPSLSNRQICNEMRFNSQIFEQSF